MGHSKGLARNKKIGDARKKSLAKADPGRAPANQSAAKPVSLAPLAFEDAVRGLLAVRPQKERADGNSDG